MCSQKKISTLKLEEKEKISKILDLEKKYFDTFWKLFTSDDFINDLKIIESEIQKNYSTLQNTWELKNKLKVPAERIARQYIYKNLAKQILHIYPSAISSDIAFITEDAVINIDIKTLDKIGNKNDISNLQFENNQSSFLNKNLDIDPELPNSGVKVECLLPTEYSYLSESPKPVLTFFFTIIYQDDGTSFSLCRDSAIQTLHLKCLPNGFLSVLFDYDLVDNFKTYTYLEDKHGCAPIYLTDNYKSIETEIINLVKRSTNYTLMKAVTKKGKIKIGVYDSKQIHPKYKTLGVSWFPVSRKEKGKTNYYLEAVHKGNTNRISNEKLFERYDSKDVQWFGVKKYKL